MLLLRDVGGFWEGKAIVLVLWEIWRKKLKTGCYFSILL